MSVLRFGILFAKGVFFGVTLVHTRAHIYKALMEGAAYALRHNMENGIKAGLKLDDECWIVGGVAKSTVWNKIFADITGYKMRQVSSLVEAPFGDAFLAGLGVGLIDKPKESKTGSNSEIRLAPTQTMGEIYEKTVFSFPGAV